MTCFRMGTGQSLRKYCIENGIKYHTIFSRCDSKGISPDEAVSTSARSYREYCLADGTPLKEACRKTGVKYTSVLGRFYDNKETVQQAFERLNERRIKRAKLFRRNGK